MGIVIKQRMTYSDSFKKIRIGSRVPEENREWLKHHGIVTDKPVAFQPVPASSHLSSLRFKKPLIMVLAALICLLPLLWFQQQTHLLSQIHIEQTKVKSLEGANFHLRGNAEKLSSINSLQRLEINRMGGQLRQLTQNFSSQVSGFQKGEAMADALQGSFSNELSRMSHEYDLQIETLRGQVKDQNQMISSLQYSLQSSNGVVVRAEPISNQGLATNGVIAAINQEFQFIVVNVGAVKGAQAGQMLEIYHGQDVVGYGQIEKIYSEYSCAKVSPSVLQLIQVGDPVFIQAKG